ncbi:hypothetical protein [Microbacterium sp. SS28]|uniref:hypothetical protein n=1 Tax=Microbacterium sp. SS28 TaxID=2919948 RepID=UPI001FAB3566|nr:hypothetical protein [Microbacterium sp. SS28]
MADYDIEALRKSFVDDVTGAKRAGSAASAGVSFTRGISRGGDGLLGGEADEAEEPETFESAMRVLLDVLADDAAVPEQKIIALERLGAAAFQPQRFAPFHAEFVERLRALALSDDKRLRLLALDRLTLEDDDEGKRMLRESLEGTRKPLVPAATAVRLLARDEHGDAAPLFRELARSGPVRVREESLRALAADAESVDLLAEVSSDKSESARMREVAAMSLKAASPERFAQVARELVLDEQEDDRLRATALSALAFAPEAADALDGEAFEPELEGIREATASRALKTSIDRYAQSRAPKTTE